MIDRPMAVSEFLRVASGIAKALGCLHAKGLVHRDIKPANLIVDMTTGEARLTGFGLASRLPRQRQAPEPPEVIAGTLAYMAPEQTGRMNRSVDSRSDLIARLPVSPCARANGIPGAISAIVMKLLAKSAEERFQTATGVEADLRHCLSALGNPWTNRIIFTRRLRRAGPPLGLGEALRTGRGDRTAARVLRPCRRRRQTRTRSCFRLLGSWQILRDGNRAGEILGRIRALFKKAEPAKEPLDLNEAIREILLLARSEMNKHQVALRLELADDLPSALGDKVQLQQVILNLILNGIEAMNTVEDHPRDLIIRTQCSDEGAVMVTVRDSGIGLDSSSMGKVFAVFHTTKPGGLGMGLSISRSIVENHQGRLWVTAQMDLEPAFTSPF